jgi:exportin-2 (importin alpha re-exporter)
MSADATQRNQAEEFLKQAEHQPGYIITMLELIQAAAAPAEVSIRLSASVQFKNFVRKYWDEEENAAVKISQADRDTVKTHLVNLMCTMPENIKKQMSVALSEVAKCDFPAKWPGLLPELISKFGQQDLEVIQGVLSTANEIFKKFRYAHPSDELYTDLKYCLEQFQAPLLQLFQMFSTNVIPASKDKKTLANALGCMRTMCRIFFSLCWQDLPEYFEDNMAAWMGEFTKYLKFQSPVGSLSDDDDVPGPVEAIQTAIIHNLHLYATKFDEEFQKYLAEFVPHIWGLIMGVDAKPRYDELATTSIQFLSAVASKVMHAQMFAAPDIQNQICERIVIPNLMLTENDEELFEDNPPDYIRSDIEGSDSTTRRHAAIGLLSALNKHFEQAVTTTCFGFLGTMLNKYTANPASEWKSKDACINLIFALCIKAQTKQFGVSQVNQFLSVNDFFAQHILPELQAADVNALPIVKADCIKFVSTFRNQLTVADVNTLFPLLIRMLTSEHYVVHTYASQCIERFLHMREAAADGGAAASTAAACRFGRAQLQPFLQPVIGGLFGVLNKEDYAFPENEFVMKCIMRVLHVAGADLAGHAHYLLDELLRILNKICANPKNPTFSHFLFESVAAFVHQVCTADQALTQAVEDKLMAPFQQVLGMDVEALTPYVFQVLAQILELRPAGNVGPAFGQLFAPLLSPTIWENRGNTPALVRLLNAYLAKDPATYLAQLNPVLGVFQKLLASKSTEGSGFELLRGVVGSFSAAQLRDVMPHVLTILCGKLQKGKASFKRQFVFFANTFLGLHGGVTLGAAFDGVQAGLMGQIIGGVWCPSTSAAAVPTAAEKKALVVGAARLLCETPAFLADRAVWAQVLVRALEHVNVAGQEGGGGAAAEKEEEQTLDDENLEKAEEGYTGGFSQLNFAKAPHSDRFAGVAPDAGQYLARQLGTVMAANPGMMQSLMVPGSPMENAAFQQKLAALLQMHGVALQ